MLIFLYREPELLETGEESVLNQGSERLAGMWCQPQDGETGTPVIETGYNFVVDQTFCTR